MASIELGYIARIYTEGINTAIRDCSSAKLLSFLLDTAETENSQRLRLTSIDMGVELNLENSHKLREQISRVANLCSSTETSRGNHIGAARIRWHDELFCNETPHEALLRNINISFVLHGAGFHTEGLKALRNTLRHCRHPDEVHHLPKCWAKLSENNVHIGRIQQARRNLIKAKSYFIIYPEPESNLGVIHLAEAKISWAEGITDEALLLIQQAMNVFLKHGRIRWYTYALSIKAGWLDDIGLFNEAAELLKGAVDELSLLDNEGFFKRLRIKLGHCLINLGRYEEAEVLLLEYRAGADKDASTSRLLTAAYRLAKVYLCQNRYHRCLEVVREFFTILPSVRSERWTGQAWELAIQCIQAEAECYIGDPGAEEILSKCRSLLEGLSFPYDSPYEVCMGYLSLARISESKGDLREALQYAQVAREIEPTHENRTAHANLVSARSYKALGEPERALEFALDALEFFDSATVTHVAVLKQLTSLICELDESAREFLNK